MNKVFNSLIVAGLIIFASCSADKASELLETAQFEELQNNKAHAQQIYEDIIRDFPESESAKKAAERLAAIKSPESN